MNTTNEVVIQAAPYVKTEDGTYVKTQEPSASGVGRASAIVTVAEGVWFPIAEIVEPEDARPVNPEGLDSLAADMDRQGQLESALLIRQADGTHKLVFGNRRLAAARKLHWEKLKVDIKENVSESERLQMILSENGEREDVSPFYIGHLYKGIMAAEKLSSEQLPDFLKKSRTTVYEYLAVAALPAEIQSMSARADIGLKHWLQIAKLPTPEAQVTLAQECAQKDYSVRELQARVKQLLNPAGSKVKEEKQSVEDTILDCHYVFDGKEVVVKPRHFRLGKENFDEYLLDIRASLTQFVTGLQGGVYQKPEAASADA